MARKRMFDLEIINQDSFLDLPMEAKAIYFLLGMEADDEGFIAPRKVLRLYGGTEDSLKLLIAKGYIIPFSTGVVVITDWKRNNYLDKNRIKETIYQDEKNQLTYNPEKEKYECLTNVQPMFKECSKNVQKMLNQNRIEENRIEENSIEEIYSSAKPNNVSSDEVKGIIDYLNLKTNSHYKHTSNKTRDLIKARFNEKYTLEDFKVVIDNKVEEWLNTDMEKYLRPETLFGTKFESYLNQKPIKKKSSNAFLDYLQEEELNDKE